jgi:hypothetical protein
MLRPGIAWPKSDPGHTPEGGSYAGHGLGRLQFFPVPCEAPRERPKLDGSACAQVVEVGVGIPFFAGELVGERSVLGAFC